jgi:hypothetical protein
MELLLLLVLVPIAWLVLLPGRVAKHARRYRFTGAGLLAGLAIAAWIGIQAFSSSTPTQRKVDYTAGDTELRAILLEPETAPRYSSRE